MLVCTGIQGGPRGDLAVHLLFAAIRTLAGPAAALSAPSPRRAWAASLVAMALLVAACGANPPTLRPSGSGAAARPTGAALAASSDPGDASLPRCTSMDLRATVAGWGGTAATRSASIVVSSRSGVACTVRGRPGVRLLDAKGKVLLDSASAKGAGGPKVVSGDPVVVVGPGDELILDVQWTNWCRSQPARPLTVALELTDRGGLVKASHAKNHGDDDAPSCAGKSRPSLVRVTHAWAGPGL